MFKPKMVECIDCGKVFEARRWRREYRCLECALGRVRASAYQMKARQGEFYARWALGMINCARRIKGDIE
jgi:DNA-directed RNA polymerase subunit RPC12/RpoP